MVVVGRAGPRNEEAAGEEAPTAVEEASPEATGAAPEARPLTVRPVPPGARGHDAPLDFDPEPDALEHAHEGDPLGK